MPIFLESLENLIVQGCGSPGCDHQSHMNPMFLHAACHLDGEIEASFRFGDDYLLIACRECHEEVVRIYITSKAKEQ